MHVFLFMFRMISLIIDELCNIFERQQTLIKKQSSIEENDDNSLQNQRFLHISAAAIVKMEECAIDFLEKLIVFRDGDSLASS